ncbi:MAG: SpoIIIAH-like family protein [Oscillospiraceae bacterium]|jgi:stage III sporulation protein AH|nr:SpoIIIAH-like family protein [Oscillospiraceae bacterium]
MKQFKKTHVVLSCLILALGAAVYLNWQFAGTTAQNPLDQTKELGKAQYVNQSVVASPDTVVTNTGNLTKEQAEYFAKARTERNQTQDKVLEIAKNVLSLAESDEDAKEDAIEQSAKISGIFAKQSNIENVLKAKGFSECMCFISDDGCSVVVIKSEMASSSTLVIKDVVKTQTNLAFDKISIVGI